MLALISGLNVAAEVNLSAEQRIRFESIHDNFRPGRLSDDITLSRTLLRASYETAQFSLHGELVDSRVWGADEDTPLNTGMVNTLEWVQAYADFSWRGLQIQLGQMTRTDDSRRILARNRFRNTTNFFRGIDITRATDTIDWRLFYLLPNEALPRNTEALDDGRRKTDRFSTARRVFGAGAKFARHQTQFDLGVIGIRDRDAHNPVQRGRHLNVLSLKVERPEVLAGWHLHSHTLYQWGRVDADAQVEQSSDLRSYMQRLALKTPVDELQRLTLTLSLDVARGDEHPDDGSFDTFDTMYGVQRFEWGPGSLYSALRRANVISPALRLDWRASPYQHDMTIRPVWLYARRDAWAGSGVRDAAGRSGRYVGTQLDIRLRRQFGDHFELEVGGAYLKYGSYARRLITHHNSGHTRYGYLQFTLKVGN